MDKKTPINQEINKEKEVDPKTKESFGFHLKPKIVDVTVNLYDPKNIPDIDGLVLNIGSGRDKLKNYINVDKYDPNADVNWDVFKMPLWDNSVKFIMAYQFLEHLSHEEAQLVAKEWARVVKPHGKILLTVPDLISVCENIIKHPEDEYCVAHMYGHQAHEGQFHKWGYTPTRLFTLFGFAGFHGVKCAYFEGGLGIREIFCEVEK